jgi:hypothetical protein
MECTGEAEPSTRDTVRPRSQQIETEPVRVVRAALRPGAKHLDPLLTSKNIEAGHAAA